MNIADLLLRRDLPIITAIIIFTMIFSIILFKGHAKVYTTLKYNISDQKAKNELLNEVKSLVTKIDTLRGNFWEGGSAAANIVADQLNRKLQDAKADSTFISVGKQEDNPYYTIIPIKATFKIEYDALENFLSYIDKNPKILDIQSVNIKNISMDIEENENKKLDVDIALNTYSLRE